MRLAEASIRVTGTERPSSVNKRLMPALRPMIPIVMSGPSAELDLDIDARRQLKFHEGVDGLVVGVDDIEYALVGAGLVLVAGVFIDVRRYQDGVAFDAGRQRDRAAHLGAGPLGCLDDFAGGTINEAMIVSLQPNSDFLIRHGEYRLVKERREQELRSNSPLKWYGGPRRAHRVRKYSAC